MVCGCSDGKLKGRKMWLEKEQRNLDRFINLSGLSLQIKAPFFFNGSFSYRFVGGGGWVERGRGGSLGWLPGCNQLVNRLRNLRGRCCQNTKSSSQSERCTESHDH